ncbi:MAG: hypothetical protein NT027_07185 [Proteobacteria bacterium]|nr:hypothetical protein [Pseudomonadota bacterium]
MKNWKNPNRTKTLLFSGLVLFGAFRCGKIEVPTTDDDSRSLDSTSTSEMKLSNESLNSELAPGKTILGPFLPAPAFSFYWINNPANCRSRVKVTSVLGENALVRVYLVNSDLANYKETLTNKFLVSLPQAASSQVPSTKTFELGTFPAATNTTMIEIRISTGQNRSKVYFEADCDVKDSDYGVSFQNGTFSPWRGLPKESLFAYVPYHAEALVLANQGKSAIAIAGVDSKGVEDANSHVFGPVNSTTKPVQVAGGKSVPLIPRHVSWAGTGVNDVLWRFDFIESAWTFAAGGFPLILSPSPAAVKKIKAGMVFDGQRVLPHAFQRDYLRFLRNKMVYFTGDTTKMIADFESMIAKGNVTLGTFPNNYLINGRYGLLTDFRSAISAQNVNRLSEWLGSSDGWQIRDPSSPHFPGVSTLIPSEIYASTSDNVIWQMVIKPIPGANNQKISNTVKITKGTTTTTMPLSDPTHWNRLSITAPILLGDQTNPDPTSNIVDSRTPMFHGSSQYDNSLSPSLAIMATLDGSKAQTPFHNPFYAQKSLLYRAALAGLTDLAALPESEIWNSPETDLNGRYAGGTIAFTMGRKVLISYGEVAHLLRKVFCSSAPTEAEKTQFYCSQFPFPAMSPQELSSWSFTADELILWKDIFATWTAGVQRVSYRLYPNDMVTSRNQSAHYLFVYQQLARGSGDPFDIALVNDYVDRWVQSQDPSGYFMEQAGPDASYIGMSNFHAATFYLISCMEGKCNQKIKESIAKVYRFFSYTVAPEPNSASNILGGFNFNHRVGAGFHNEQFGGARGIALDIPEVSAWTANSLLPTGKAQQKVPSLANYSPGKSQRLDLGVPRFISYQYMTEATPAKFPATLPGSFTLDVQDAKQLIAVKRPGYFTSFYVGRPVVYPLHIASINDPKHRLAWKDNGESTGAAIGDPHYWSAAYVGGGMSLFWTPEFGSSVLAGNWTPLAHHGLVAVDGMTGVRSWEDYFSTSYQLAADKSSLVTTGKLEAKPCVFAKTPQELCSGMENFSYVRAYRFLDDTINVSTTISAAANAVATQGSTLFENIPLAGGKPKIVGTIAPTVQSISPQEVIYRGSNGGPGLRIRFRNAAFSRNINNGPMNAEKLQINRVELGIKIPQAGETTKLEYCLQPVSADPVKCGF